MSIDLSFVVSAIALLISVSTFWLTRIKKGRIRMTKPAIICLTGRNESDEPKIFIRTLLYSTADNGQYVQNMFVRLIHKKGVQNFNIWAYGDNGLVRGSGLFVDKKGVSIYHHFLLPKEDAEPSFEQGDYLLEVFVETVGKKARKTFEDRLHLSEEQSTALNQDKVVFFDWLPDRQEYISHIDAKPQPRYL